MMPATEPIGLLAGWGRLPTLFAEKAKSLGIPVICVGIRGMADRAALEPHCYRFYWTRLAALNRPARCFKREGVRRWAMAGKVFKNRLFTFRRILGMLTLMPDLRMIRFFFRKRANNADDTLTLALIDEYARDGLICSSALDLCPELLVRPGVLTRRSPTALEEADIEYGWHLAKEMGRLDIGQSVAVRERAVLAVEAVEGTDACIRRAGELCKGGGFVVVKVAKPQQDMRFDVPTIGPSTIESMRAAGGKVLALEAEKTVLIDEPDTIRLADQAGIAIVAR
jgi:DUF1009 family protein